MRNNSNRLIVTLLLIFFFSEISLNIYRHDPIRNSEGAIMRIID